MFHNPVLSEEKAKIIRSTLFAKANYEALAKKLEVEIPHIRTEVEEPEPGTHSWFIHCYHGASKVSLAFVEMSPDIEAYLRNLGGNVQDTVISSDLSEIKEFIRKSFEI